MIFRMFPNVLASASVGVLLSFVLLTAHALRAEGLVIGDAPPTVTLHKKDGGRVDGTAWASSELTGKVYTVFYVDPDEQELNEHVEQALKKEDFPKDKYGSVAIVNMKATWIPNFLIAKRLKRKQNEFTSTTFVKDKKKVLVKSWGLTDNGYHILVFDKTGKLAFSQGTKLTDEDIAKLISVIRHHL